MASDYPSLRRENERRYGTGVRKYGDALLPARYGDRTQFIYELLQNAEDALARRETWTGRRSVQFQLAGGALRVRHFGIPFDQDDVRSICGIGESTKDRGLTEIGRFGIGFKSVYAYTDRPEVHSGPEDFAIEDYVLPVAAPEPAPRDAEETVFVLPLRTASDAGEIGEAVRRLAPRALLFLREIEEIEWQVEDGASGLYLRETDSGAEVRRVTLAGEAEGQRETEQTWLVFARTLPSSAPGGGRHLEVAFRLGEDGRLKPVPAPDTPLFAFFPTTVATGLHFRIQGPFRTTLARDNLPPGNAWNEELMAGIAEVLGEALCWLRDHERLDLEAFDCLPLDREPFPAGSLFGPLRSATIEALRSEALLPRFGGGRVAGQSAFLAAAGWLRELFDGEQLAVLFGGDDRMGWLSEEVTRNRTPGLYQALVAEAGVRTVRPDGLPTRLDADFLEAQPDDWVRKLYETLAEHGGPRDRWRQVPLVRLSDGSHVRAADGERPAAFLPAPAPAPADLPTVRAAVCDTPASRKFLCELGLAPPDPVDHVLRTVVPRYRGRSANPTPEGYAADFGTLVEVYTSSQRTARRRLERALRGVAFVPAVDLGTGVVSFATAEATCFATGSQRELFDGVRGVRVVDNDRPALRGEGAGALLQAIGVRRLLEPVFDDSPLRPEDWREVRETLSGASGESGITRVEDWNLLGLDALLPVVGRMPAPERRRRAELLRQELEGLPEINDLAVRSGKYEWEPTGDAPRTEQIPAGWMRRLNRSGWAPDVRPAVSIRSPETGARTSAARSPGPTLGVLPASGETLESADPDHRRRLLEVENDAIRFIRSREPRWERAPQENAGFDLFQRNERGETVSWCEVKALRRTLENHRVALTLTQARFALERHDAYWLYIVESTGSKNPRILRIRNPVGRAGRLTFGPEWRSLAADTPPP